MKRRPLYIVAHVEGPVGGRATLSPSLTGGEPLRFTKDGRRVYIVEKEVTAAAALPSLPPSVANVLQPLRGTRGISFTSETAAEAGSAPADAEVSGSHVLTLRIR